MALIDHDLIRSALSAASATALTLSPLALVVIALLLPYVYRLLFLRAKLDKRSYEETKSKTAPMVRRLRRHLDFAARRWADYLGTGKRNLKYRIEVSLLYDLTKAAAAYYASDQWREHMRRHGVAELVFMDEDKSLRENLDQNGFFLSSFFKEGVVNRYLMRPTSAGFGSVRVEGDPVLLARATTLFREALREMEPQFEQGHIYLPFLTLSRWERLRFRIHTMIITRLLSEGMEKAVALLLSYGLVALLKGESASTSAVDFIMDIVALLFMAHVFDTVLKNRCGQFKTNWEDRERYYYRRQMHQFIVGLDSTMVREEARREKEAVQLLCARTQSPRGIKRIVRTLKRATRHPWETPQLLSAAKDVMEFDQTGPSPIALIFLKELATSYPPAYAKLLRRWRTFRHPWAATDKLVSVLLSDEPLLTVAARNARTLPDRDSHVEWQRAAQALHHDFPSEVDEARVAHLTQALAAETLTPPERRALVLCYFFGGLLWRLRQMDPENPLGRRRDARLYHSTRTLVLPALVRIQARQASAACDYGLKPSEIAGLIERIKSALPLPAGHQLRLKLGDGHGVVPALEEIQRAVAVKKQPASSSPGDLPTQHLREWLETYGRDRRTLGVLAGALHEAALTGLGAKLDKRLRAGTDSLMLDPHAFDSNYNPLRAPAMRQHLARRGIDGQDNEPVLALLGFWGRKDVKPVPLGQIPIRLTFLDLQPVVDYVSDRSEDFEALEEITHEKLVEFYVAARMAGNVHELPYELTRPAEGDDTGGSIARQMAIIRALRAGIIADQEPLFLLLQAATHELEVILNPLHADMDHLLGQASVLGPALAEATRWNLYRMQDAGLALLIPLTCMAESVGLFADTTDAYWAAREPTTDQARFFRQFDIQNQEHADALVRTRILLHQFEALRSLIPAHATKDRAALASFDTMAGDAELLRTGAATLLTLIDQSGLRTDARFRAVREVLSVAMTRQGYCNRGNLSDLVRVTLKLRDSAGNTMFLTRGTLTPARSAAVLAPDLQATVVERKPAQPPANG